MSEKQRYLSETSTALAEDVTTIMKGYRDIDKIQESATLGQWVQFIMDYTGMMPEDLLNEKMTAKILENWASRFNPGFFPGNSVICVTALPCNAFGDPLGSDEIADGDFMERLVLWDMMGDLGKLQRLLFDLMPPEIRQQCAFEVGTPEADPVKFKARILSQCSIALKNLQQLLIDGHKQCEN